MDPPPGQTTVPQIYGEEKRLQGGVEPGLGTGVTDKIRIPSQGGRGGDVWMSCVTDPSLGP